MAKKKKSPRRKAKATKKAEVERLAEFLREQTPAAPEVLVPKTTAQALLDEVRTIVTAALKSPREEILGRAERTVVEGGRKLLKLNEQYGLSVSGLIRTTALHLFKIPSKS